MILFLIEAYEKLRETICGVEPCSAIPEHWQIPLEARRPQLVLQLAEPKEDEDGLQSAKHVITIPHYIGTVDDPAPIQYMDKGNYQGILTLADNSKVMVYGQSQYECWRVIEAIKPWIDPDQLTETLPKYDVYPTANIKQVRVYPKYASYWPPGPKSGNPEWTIHYSYDP